MGSQDCPALNFEGSWQGRSFLECEVSRYWSGGAYEAALRLAAVHQRPECSFDQYSSESMMVRTRKVTFADEGSVE